MARPRPSAPPVQTGSHQQAERCVKTWTASAWWSSSCPSSQFHHLGPTALREREREREATNSTINHHWHHLHRLPNHYSCSSAVSYTLPHSPSTVQWNNCSAAPFCIFPACQLRLCVCGVIIAQTHPDKSDKMRVWTPHRCEEEFQRTHLWAETRRIMLYIPENHGGTAGNSPGCHDNSVAVQYCLQ